MVDDMTALPALRPPPEFEALRWHWLLVKEGDVVGPIPTEWRDEQWITRGFFASCGPEEAAEVGWRYLKPCVYENAPSDADVERVKKLLAALKDVDRFSLVISSAVRISDPGNLEPVVNVLLEARAAIAAMKDGS